MANEPSQLVNVVIPVIAIAVTAVATWFVSRKNSGSTFTADVLKENGYLRERLTNSEAENKRLAKENLDLYRTILRKETE